MLTVRASLPPCILLVFTGGRDINQGKEEGERGKGRGSGAGKARRWGMVFVGGGTIVQGKGVRSSLKSTSVLSARNL